MGRGLAARFVAALGGSILLLTSIGCRSERAPSESEVADLLRRQTQELMDAVAPGEAEVWRRYLLEDAMVLDENGVLYDKEALLRELTPLPPGLVGRIEVDKFEMTLHGDIAVSAAEVQEYLDYHGQDLRTRFRFLDTWLRTGDGWRLAARHTAAVLKDPPPVPLSRDDLCSYSGLYELTPEITASVRCGENGLIVERTGRPATIFLPEARDVFFEAGKPRSRRIFSRDAGGAVVGFADRREGEDIRWKRIGDAPRVGEETRR